MKQEIREAIEKRREASREPRKAKKEKRPQDGVSKIWKIYLEKKIYRTEIGRGKNES